MKNPFMRRPTTVRGVLDVIDAAFQDLHPSGSAIDLWNVLTALRGPDSEDGALKDRTTAAIRGAAFPRLLKEGNYLPAIIRPANMFDGSDLAYGDHFAAHVRYAADVLGLEKGIGKD